MLWKINLILEHGMNVVLNDVRSSNPGWTDSQPTKIERLEFSFLDKHKHQHKLILAGMSEYNFFVEGIKKLSMKDPKIQGIWFLGKIPRSERVVGFVFKDTVLKLTTMKGREYMGTSSAGWKPGIVGGTIIAEVVKE
jgi:hypothetical protein